MVWKQGARHTQPGYSGNNASIIQLQKEIENVRYLGSESSRERSTRIDEYATPHSSLFEKLVKEEANNDWGQALALVDMVHKELLEVEAQLQNMGKGAVPPSHSVQNLVARLEALEQDHAQLKTDVRLLQPLQPKQNG